ncbi:hypothetical protein, partial [Paractinoplanes durhamensis]|uniref:hypothetical protein n=1 Tax=Paractinoplanes durhamensis TaxID=113563 RepID=UPI003629AF21
MLDRSVAAAEPLHPADGGDLGADRHRALRVAVRAQDRAGGHRVGPGLLTGHLGDQIGVDGLAAAGAHQRGPVPGQRLPIGVEQDAGDQPRIVGRHPVGRMPWTS